MKKVTAYQFTAKELAEAFRLYIVRKRAFPERFMGREKTAQFSAQEWADRSAGFIVDLLMNGESALDRLH